MARKLDTEGFVIDLLARLGRVAKQQAREAMTSKTLKRDTYVLIDNQHTAHVIVPYYWAIYHHDGRRAIDLTGKDGYLVYFSDPKNDPRTDGTKRYPRTRSEVKHLSKAQFRAGLEENAKRRAAGGEPYMIVTKKVGPADGTFFFSEGLREFPDKAARIVQEEFVAHALRGIPRLDKAKAAVQINK